MYYLDILTTTEKCICTQEKVIFLGMNFGVILIIKICTKFEIRYYLESKSSHCLKLSIQLTYNPLLQFSAFAILLENKI